MFEFNAHDLRHRSTLSERVMWNSLRARQMLGLKFRRQHPIGPFIVDFVCLKKKIIIEMDGPVHDGQRQYDQRRDQWLKKQGYTVLRIRNQDLDQNREAVLLRLRAYLLKKVWK